LAIADVWPELTSMKGAYGCWNRRRVVGGTAWSMHAEGRALDVGVPASQNAAGWGLACDLTVAHAALDVQRVIWDHHIWSIEEAAGWRRLRPTSLQHVDHLHVEHRWNGANKPATIRAEYTARLRLERTR